MQGGAISRTDRRGGGLALTLLALALFMRLLVPAGWMPSADGRSITLCTSMGAVQAWVAADGSVHEKAPGSDADKASQPCIFAALGVAILAPDPVAGLAAVDTAPALAIARAIAVAIGRGLAAPPPPPTGPPATL